VISRVLAGDRDLYRILVVRHGALAKRTAMACGAGADVDDVVQEAFVSAYQALPRFRLREEFRPWLLRIVANHAHNATRRRRRGAELADRVAVWRWEEIGDQPADDALSAERRAELVGAMSRLAAADREILALRFLLDLSEADTATVLKLAKGTVKSRTSRALGRLRALLGSPAAALTDGSGR
jgi:RNA polymerase sigma factor (sigma-70 family)